MKKIYLLTNGYEIIGAFSTRELAEEARYLNIDNDDQIEEYDIDSEKLLNKEGRKNEVVGEIYTVGYNKLDKVIRDRLDIKKGYRDPNKCKIKKSSWAITVESPISREHAKEVLMAALPPEKS